MGKRNRAMVIAAGFLLAMTAAPAIGHAAQMMGGVKYTLSLTKDYTPSPWTSEVKYSNRALGKLGFGIKNLLVGWVDLFTEPKEAVDAGDNFFVGLGIGLKDALFNELGGAVHVVTFPMTCVDAPLPEGGTTLFQ